MIDPYPTRGTCSQVIARQDPVVYGSGLQPGLADYERDGYLFMPQLFQPAETAALLREAERLRDNASSSACEVFFERTSGAVRSIFAIHRSANVFAAVCEDPRLLSLVQDILGDEVYVHQSRLNYKPAFSGREFYWHSDFETWHAEDGMPRMRAVSVSLALTPSLATNGPLMLIPGSHHSFVPCIGKTPPDHYRQSLVKQEYGVPDRESIARMAGDRGITAPTGAAGSVVLFDCNAMHGSNGNITPFPRTNLFVVYNAVSNKLQQPFGAQVPRPEFVASRRNIPILKQRDR